MVDRRSADEAEDEHAVSTADDQEGQRADDDDDDGGNSRLTHKGPTGIVFMGFANTWISIARRVRSRLLKPLMALIGALILVSLFRVGERSPAFVLGNTLAEALQGGWLALSVALGAVGSFFRYVRMCVASTVRQSHQFSSTITQFPNSPFYCPSYLV
jgi:hypothetical protein